MTSADDQIDSTAIVDKKSKDISEKTTMDLATMQEELTSLPELPEVEWTRLRALEFQEVLRQRTSYLDRIVKLGCQLCENFEDHVSFFVRLPRMLRSVEWTDDSTQRYTRSRWSRVV
jgi:hypothetical protein